MKKRSRYPGATAFTDRHGVRRWRYRRKGKNVALGTDYGSDAFTERYEAAVRGDQAKTDRLTPGTINALCASYYSSPGYLKLSPLTRKNYRAVLEKIRIEHAEKRVSHIERRHIVVIMSKRAGTPAAANFILRMFRLILKHAVVIGMREDNPAIGIEKYATNPDGFHTWTEDEIAAFYRTHKIGTLAHTAMTLMLCTGAPRVDAVKLGWGNVAGGRIRYRRQKTQRLSSIVVDVPILPELASVLDQLPRDAFTFLQTSTGRSRSSNGLGNTMRKWCDQAGLPDCSSHGLRKALARRLAKAGCTTSEIQAVTGHATSSEVDRYTRDANRSGMAVTAMEKVQELPNPVVKLTKSDP